MDVNERSDREPNLSTMFVADEGGIESEWVGGWVVG